MTKVLHLSLQKAYLNFSWSCKRGVSSCKKEIYKRMSPLFEKKIANKKYQKSVFGKVEPFVRQCVL
jgi:hypothetical protein